MGAKRQRRCPTCKWQHHASASSLPQYRTRSKSSRLPVFRSRCGRASEWRMRTWRYSYSSVFHSVFRCLAVWKPWLGLLSSPHVSAFGLTPLKNERLFIVIELFIFFLKGMRTVDSCFRMVFSRKLKTTTATTFLRSSNTQTSAVWKKFFSENSAQSFFITNNATAAILFARLRLFWHAKRVNELDIMLQWHRA